MTANVPDAPEAPRQAPDWYREWLGWFGIVTDGDDEMNPTADPRKADLERRFDGVGWGLVFLLIAALALPKGNGEYASAAAVGAGMLVLNAVRVVAGVPVRWFTIVLGATMLVAGSAALAGTHMDALVLFFVLLGAVSIGAAIVGPRRSTAG